MLSAVPGDVLHISGLVNILGGVSLELKVTSKDFCMEWGGGRVSLGLFSTLLSSWDILVSGMY